MTFRGIAWLDITLSQLYVTTEQIKICICNNSFCRYMEEIDSTSTIKSTSRDCFAIEELCRINGHGTCLAGVDCTSIAYVVAGQERNWKLFTASSVECGFTQMAQSLLASYLFLVYEVRLADLVSVRFPGGLSKRLLTLPVIFSK